MRIVFMGTPGFAADVLAALVAAGHDVAAAYSQPPRRAGRGKLLTPSPVQARAEALAIPVRTPISLRTAEAQADFASFRPDIAAVFAYGLILPPAILDMPRHGCLNLHASLLPRWRGAAPVARAILTGDAETGVCVMQMAAGLDTGPVRLAVPTPIARKTAGELTAELAALGAAALIRVLADLDAFPPLAQPGEGVSYAAKLDKAEARLDWSRPAEQVDRQVRGFNPPGAWFELSGERVRVLACDLLPLPAGGESAGEVTDDRLTIACGTGAIRPTLLQRAGRAVMTAEELLRGFPIPAGTRL